jgi:hypothetical protein
LGVKCVDVKLLERLRVTHGETNYTGDNRYTNPNLACSYPLIWTFNEYLSNEEILCIIDSDMFFIKDIDIEKEIYGKDIIYIPQYRNPSVKYIWNAFVCLNFVRNHELRKLDWHPGRVNNIPCDVGGQTHYSLLSNNFDCRYVDEHSIFNFENKSNNEKSVIYSINGNSVYNIFIDSEDKFTKVNHTGGVKFSDEKSFEHEVLSLSHSEYLRKRLFSVIEILEKNDMNDIPNPKNIGFIGFQDSDDFFIVHYRSGSNYLSFYTPEYNKIKTDCIKKLLSK